MNLLSTHIHNRNLSKHVLEWLGWVTFFLFHFFCTVSVTSRLPVSSCSLKVMKLIYQSGFKHEVVMNIYTCYVSLWWDKMWGFINNFPIKDSLQRKKYIIGQSIAAYMEMLKAHEFRKYWPAIIHYSWKVQHYFFIY